MEDTNQTSNNQNATPEQPNATHQTSSEPVVNSSMDNKKLFAIIGYILPILFFLPLIDDKLKTDVSARFHANQQLVLLIASLLLHFVVSSVLGIVLGPLMFLLGNAINLVIIVFVVMGVLNVINGADKELPVIGKFRLIK